MHTEWVAMEQYRIQVMEQWPDGPGKDCALAAARSALACLLGEASPERIGKSADTGRGRNSGSPAGPRTDPWRY
jgi:hypothetical protein